MRIKLNTTRSSRDRYWLTNGSMGCYGEPKNHANHVFEVVNGVDKGNGYQGYMSVSYAMAPQSYMPEEARINLRKELTRLGYYLDTLLKTA